MRHLFTLALLAFWISTVHSFVVGDSRRIKSWKHRRRIGEHAIKEKNDDDNNNDGKTIPPPLLFELDPTSDQAHSIIIDQLKLSEQQYEQLVMLCTLVLEWNEKINLISRKNCRISTIFGRHILPSLACCAMIDQNNPLNKAKLVIDVGTGGGFPGLPLAIAYPTIQFCLLDSVGKKLTAVEAMANELNLNNVQIHHGRSEDFANQKFDVVLGRSVTAIPQFCVWIEHLLQKDTGHLMYWIGGDIPTNILDYAKVDYDIMELIPNIISDKRILIFPQASVHEIARSSGIKKVQRTTTNKPDNDVRKKKQPQKSKDKAKGAWQKRKSDEPKQRGYDNFQRYNSQ